eukprot:gb/GECG01013377.1/.p1 GENE.gb/GECG01013377.1/~~gb/GECG01013377.1/.p1  ORF type:complete len:256 (+),score=34.01 gb/GECG01013377.1/:1-768(+)
MYADESTQRTSSIPQAVTHILVILLSRQDYMGDLANITHRAASGLEQFIAKQADATECATSQVQLILGRLGLIQEQVGRDSLWSLEATPQPLYPESRTVPIENPKSSRDEEIPIQKRLDKVELTEKPTGMNAPPPGFAVREAFAQPTSQHERTSSNVSGISATHTVPKKRPTHKSSASVLPSVDQLESLENETGGSSTQEANSTQRPKRAEEMTTEQDTATPASNKGNEEGNNEGEGDSGPVLKRPKYLTSLNTL